MDITKDKKENFLLSPGLPLASCVILGKSLNFFVLQLPGL